MSRTGTTKTKRQTVNTNGVVIAAFARSAAGPGWANSPIWVIVRRLDGTLIEDCVQPSEQTAEQRILYRVSMAAHEAMTGAERRRRGSR